ncbi:MAG: META domain-containing protein [Ignavibacteria bacterium]|nr:META domain-containing protein [Ignavibacteria bacterium]
MKKITLLIFTAVLLIVGCSSSKKTGVAYEDLKNTRWVLKELNSSPVTDTKQDIYVIFGVNDNKFNGFGGCNKFFGTYDYDGKTLKISDFGSTKMFCTDDKYEIKFFDVLNSFDDHKIAEKYLYLYKSGKVLAKFEAIFL